MSRKLRSMLGFGLALTACGALAPAASADGLPVPFDGGDNTGVASLDGDFRYSTVAAGADTVAVKTSTATGEIQRTVLLRGDYGVPLVAYDGTPSGLSADGETLALIRPRTRFPRQTTDFVFLDTERLRVRDELTLRGDFSFDTLSPDGRRMYLIRYVDPRDPTSYEVRVYDLQRERLLEERIVDPDEPAGAMFGLPQTRAVSPDGRWAYTLYSRTDHHAPFIHVLDTETGTALCIDLDGFSHNNNAYRLGLQPSADGATLGVIDRGEPIANVDLDSFKVNEAGAPAAPAAEAAAADDGGPPWLAIGATAVLLALASGSLVVARRRRGRRVDEHGLADLVRGAEVADAEAEAREREPVA
jgi:hypothetical protein